MGGNREERKENHVRGHAELEVTPQLNVQVVYQHQLPLQGGVSTGPLPDTVVYKNPIEGYLLCLSLLGFVLVLSGHQLLQRVTMEKV